MIGSELSAEQQALAADRDPVLLRPRARPLLLIKATSTGPGKLGETVRVYDSDKTRTIARSSGWLPCDGETFNELEWPELRRLLGSNRTPIYEANTR